MRSVSATPVDSRPALLRDASGELGTARHGLIGVMVLQVPDVSLVRTGAGRAHQNLTDHLS
jgi:hypothetical protein